MSNFLDEMDRVVLTEALPGEELDAGAEGRVVMVYRHGVGGYTGPNGYTVEFDRGEEGGVRKYSHVNLGLDQVKPARETAAA